VDPDLRRDDGGGFVAGAGVGCFKKDVDPDLRRDDGVGFVAGAGSSRGLGLGYSKRRGSRPSSG
jgi:hypothetical protein